MDETTTRRDCPYCAEAISENAIRCPHCRSRLLSFDPAAWRRDYPERKVAGVAAAIANATGVPIGAVRVGFIVGTFFHLLGPVLYGLGWLLIPNHADEPSVVERTMDDGATALRRLRRGEPTPPFPGGHTA